MSLLNRQPVRVGRAQRKERDDRLFLVATEDSDAPKQYFEHLRFPRVQVVVIPTPKEDCRSAPRDVVDRLKDAFKKARSEKEVLEDDEFWVLLDTDHRTQGTHVRGTMEAIRDARAVRFEVAFSRPCFELWLLLHHADVLPEEKVEGSAPGAEELESRLRGILGGYNKTKIKAEHFPVNLVPEAIRRARALEQNPDSPAGLWPEVLGTRVYRLMERISGTR